MTQCLFKIKIKHKKKASSFSSVSLQDCLLECRHGCTNEENVGDEVTCLTAGKLANKFRSRLKSHMTNMCGRHFIYAAPLNPRSSF